MRIKVRMVGGNIHSDSLAIRCQVPTRGLLVQCDDLKILDEFEEHIRTISGHLDLTPSLPIVFYLKYTKAAIRMLAEMLDGGDAASGAESGSLVNGSSLFSSYLGSRSLVPSRRSVKPEE